MDLIQSELQLMLNNAFIFLFNMESRQHFIVKYERSLADFH